MNENEDTQVLEEANFSSNKFKDTQILGEANSAS